MASQAGENLKLLADRQVAAGNYQEAESLYTQAAAVEPGRAGPLVGLGAVAFQTGKLDEARRCFQLAAWMDRTCAAAHCGLGMVYQERQDFAWASDAYLKCLELDGDNMVALLGLFQSSCRLGNFSRITNCLETYLKDHPLDVPVRFCLASLYARQGDWAKARAGIDQVLALDPTNVEAAQLEEEIRRAQNMGAAGDSHP